MVGVRGVTGGLAAATSRGRAGGGGFRVGGSAPQAAAAPASQAEAAGAVGLLALQECAPAAERDARARKRGEGLLRELAALQAELLAGRVDAARLRALVALSEGTAAADPALAEVVAAISLRARIEAARLEMDASLSRD